MHWRTGSADKGYMNMKVSSKQYAQTDHNPSFEFEAP